MEPQEFLQAVYDSFREHARWPPARELQVTLRRHGTIRRIAIAVGEDDLCCESGADGVCFLRLRGLQKCSGAEDDIDAFVGAIRHSAQHYIEHGPTAITSAELASALSLDRPAVKRLSNILYRNGGIWSGAGWSQDYEEFQLTPKEDAVFYEDIEDWEQYFTIADKLAADRIATSTLSARRRVRAPMDSISMQRPRPPDDDEELRIRINLVDSGLQRVFDRDVSELNATIQANAWKASAILAGSCLEAILLDLWKRHDDEARYRWKQRWPEEVRVVELARAAVKKGLLAAHHEGLANTIRRARNLIHPALAAKEPGEPSRELAAALVAFLRLIARDLADQDAVNTPN
jgi:hypothetical protein